MEESMVSIARTSTVETVEAHIKAGGVIDRVKTLRAVFPARLPERAPRGGADKSGYTTATTRREIITTRELHLLPRSSSPT
ncbi:hypothetical protein IG631_10070 [Alternaria alternata]|nr:hypothetical protein IG631_10070 [Alternaria alternata]